jgi:hypothetical protein
MSDWNFVNRHRVTTGMFASSAADGCNGFFCLILDSRKIKVIASDTDGWQHVSVSIEGSDHTPSWSIMCQVKDMFFDSNDWVMQLHPPKENNISNHPGCLHLWRPTESQIPIPPAIMVGCSDLGEIDSPQKMAKAMQRYIAANSK